MKAVRGVLLGFVLVVGLATLRPSVSFAHTEHSKTDIKLLRDAASALQQSRPDLATALNAYADRETKELGERLKERGEKEEMGERVEPKNERKENRQY